MGKYVLCNHGGSGNHGCEALVRTAATLLGKENVRLLSDAPEQDKEYKIDELMRVDSAINGYSKFSPQYLKAYANLKRTGDYFDMDVLPYIKALDQINKDEIAVSIGGDNYCYDFYPKFIRMHQRLVKRGIKTVLLGCSLEEELFKDNDFTNDMKSYSLITARESITYELLKVHGIDNVKLISDSAFTLPTENITLPDELKNDNTIGINVSPLVERKEKKKGIVFENFKNLIAYILQKTDLDIALIPHVIWKSNDDRVILKRLMDEFSNNDRIAMIDDCNCMQLKGYISRCKFFIGARTHATIAAYSSCVPTLVLGYSVKSRGIARDLFGTEEKYVLPVDSLKSCDDLINSFVWMQIHEQEIRRKLIETMPSYIEKTSEIKSFCEKI